jgi:very-short-patch-repair endonuclease
MRNLTGPARRLRRESTEHERRLWQLLRGRQMDGLKFRRQHPLGGFVLDFYCEALRLCIELDGGQHADRIDHDANRTAALEKLGVTVVRFWNVELTEAPEAVWQRLQETIINLQARREVTSPIGRGRAKRG